MLAIKWDNITAEAEPWFSPPWFQAAAERNAYIIFQVIKSFCFDFQEAGERKREGYRGRDNSKVSILSSDGIIIESY